MSVHTTEGNVLGVVQGWYELPQGVMLDIKGEGQEALVPYREEFVREVDAGKRQIVVQLPTGYLD
jgi:ribosomal 30S subunit maturation factor RimM